MYVLPKANKKVIMVDISSTKVITPSFTVFFKEKAKEKYINSSNIQIIKLLGNACANGIFLLKEALNNKINATPEEVSIILSMYPGGSEPSTSSRLFPFNAWYATHIK